MAYNILVSDSLSPEGLNLLRAIPDFNVIVGPFSREETLERIPEADALIVRSATKVNADMIAAAPRLKAVARAGAGVDNIDLAAATAHGIAVMNTPGANTIAATEHTLGLMLALARHIPEAHQSLRDGRWDRKLYMGTELRGKTLGIIGLGRIGEAVAKRAGAFEMTVIAYDPNKAPVDGVELVDDLDDLYARSDYIALHAPANDETYHVINADSIARMKDGVRIINVARGTLIDPTALAAAIQSGKVAGAAVDVYTPEPPEAGYPLVGMAGVIHTPHLGASTLEAQEMVAYQAAELIRDALLENRFANVVNAAVLKAAPSGD
jgi:D-3-phosphoglycerate dehydrogenase